MYQRRAGCLVVARRIWPYADVTVAIRVVGWITICRYLRLLRAMRVEEMHVQANPRLVHHETNKTDADGHFGVTTLQGLGKYLQGLRESVRVTQTSLSVKTGAMAGRKISRSRISEIENAKRDRVSERELRVYMAGLRCAPHHIDRMIKVLRQCTVTAPKESTVSPVPADSATPDPYLAGLAGAKDDLIPGKEKSEDERDERWAQLSRRRWQYHNMALVGATALVVVALMGLGAEFFPRQESAGPSTSRGSSDPLLLLPSAPLLVEDTTDLIQNATAPVPALVQVDKRPTQTSEIQNRPAGEAAGRDTTEHLIGSCCVHPGQAQEADVGVLPSIKTDWHGYATGTRGGSIPGRP